MKPWFRKGKSIAPTVSKTRPRGERCAVNVLSFSPKSDASLIWPVAGSRNLSASGPTLITGSIKLGARLHLQVQALVPGQGEGKEDHGREGRGRDADEQPYQPTTAEAPRPHCGGPKSRMLNQSGRMPSGGTTPGTDGHRERLGLGVGSFGEGGAGTQGGVGTGGAEIV